jgi:predicted PurR-regulated permease PerM
VPKRIEISTKSIFTAIGVVLGLWFVYSVWDIALSLVVAIILAAALGPSVDRLTKLKVPRPFAILAVYIILISVLSLVVAAVATPLLDQTRKLITLLPNAIRQVDFLNNHQEEITTQLLSQVGTLPENLVRVVISIFSNVFSLFVILTMSFYLLLERGELDQHLSTFFGSQAHRISSVVKNIEATSGSWVRGELILMFTIGVTTYLGLLLLGVDIALPLAIIAGVLELLPNVGPFISAIPAILVAFTIHPLLALATAILYVLIQLFENSLLVPRVMSQAVGVNPIVVILCVMIGNRLAGPLGAILAVPIFVACRTIVQEFQAKS